MRNVRAKVNEYRGDNTYCARLVLRDPEHYGSGMVAWAREVLAVPENAAMARAPEVSKPKVDRGGQSRLF